MYLYNDQIKKIAIKKKRYNINKSKSTTDVYHIGTLRKKKSVIK